MRRTTHAREFAQVAAASLILLAFATFIIAAVGALQPVFMGRLNRGWTVLAAFAFLAPGIGLARRQTWGWYLALLVLAGFVSGGLVQIVASQPIGIATVLVGLAVFYCVVRSSSEFPDAIYPMIPDGSPRIDRGPLVGGGTHAHRFSE